MKILRKPKLSPMTCKRCGCLFQAKLRDLKINLVTKTRDDIICPTCKTVNKAIFDLAEVNNENCEDTE